MATLIKVEDISKLFFPDLKEHQHQVNTQFLLSLYSQMEIDDIWKPPSFPHWQFTKHSEGFMFKYLR